MIKLIKNIDKFKSLIEMAKNLNREVKFEITKENILLKIIDVTNISILQIKINKSFFEEYTIENDYLFLLNIEEFFNCISLTKQLNISISESTVDFYDGKFNFKIKFFQTQKEEKNVPIIDYKTEYNVNSDDLFNNAEKLSYISESIKLIGDENISIKLENSLIEAQTKIISTKIKGENVESYYSLNYIDKLSSLKNIFDNVTLNFDKDMPLTLKADNIDLNIIYVLAPRIK